MTCYCTYFTFPDETAMDAFMDWINEHGRASGIIRGKAWPEPPRWNGEDLTTSGKWLSRIVLKTEDDARRLYRQWEPRYSDDWKVAPWR